MFRLPLVTFVILSFAATAPAVAQQQAPPPSHQAVELETIDAVDENFLHRAAVGGLAEMSLGRLAASHATQTDIKKFGATLSNERGKLNDRLLELAAQEGWELPDDIDADHRAKIDAVANKDGLEFNAVFADVVVESARTTVALFRETAQESRAPAVREFAREALPMLERHLRMAQALKQEVAGR